MRVRSSCGVLGAALVSAAVACAGEIDPFATAAERFEALLSGANEVPAVTTSATGTASLWVMADTFLVYRLDVTALDSPTVAHIHAGGAGVNDSVIVTLYPGPTRGRGYTGPLRFGQLKPSQLTQLPAPYGANSRARFDSLLGLMRASNAYVDVHTRRNLSGELRAQVERP
jgi:CHRD domain-containing protein